MGTITREELMAAREATKKVNKKETRTEKRETREEMEEIESSFKLDEALDEPGFADFLAAFPDNESIDLVEGNDVIKSRFLLFREKEKVGQSLKSVWLERIKLDTGVQLDAGDLDSVDSYLNNLAVNDLESFKALSESRRKFELTTQEIKETEAQIQELLDGSSQDDLEEEIEDLKFAKKHGFFRTLFNREAKKKKEAILESYGITEDDLEKALRESTTNLDQLKRVRAAQDAVLKEFSKAQKAIFTGEIEPLKQAREKVMKKIEASLTSLTANADPSIKEADKVAAMIKKIRESSKTGSGSIINYVEGYDDTLEGMEMELEHNVLRVLQTAAEAAVLSMKNKKLSEVEASINKALEKMSKDGLDSPENRAVFIEKIKEVADKETDKGKKLLLRRIIIKLKK